MTTPPARLVSLDAYRGVVMAALLFGGVFASLRWHPDWYWLYVQNDHVEWEGCCLWDLIQPAFMFIVGVAMPFAFAVRSAKGDTWTKQLLHVFVRAGGLILVGVALDNFGASTWSFGFIRVLQQIAFGYVVAFLVLGRPLWVQGLVAAVILVGYLLFWVLNPWNGPGGPWAMGGDNAGKVFDHWLLGLWGKGRNYSGNYVGLNAIPSAANMIFGVMAGQVLLNTKSRGKAALVLAVAGVLGIVIGFALSPAVPLVKRIWTPSFAVYSAGWTTLFLAGFYWAIDVMGSKWWTYPLVVVGMNSIAAYVIGQLFGGWFRSLVGVWVNLLDPLIGPTGVSVAHRLLFFAAAWCVLWWLYRRRIFFKL